MHLPFVITYAAISALYLAVTRAAHLADSLDLKVETVFRFPVGTWVENLHLRSNGYILASTITAPKLYQINPFAATPTPELLYTFPAPAASALGIVETKPDLFFVIASNFSVKTFTGTRGSSSIWSVDFRSTPAKPKVRKIVDVYNATALDGLAVLNEDAGYLLAGDITYGAVYFIDTEKRKAYTTIDIPLMKATSKLPVGVDGLKMPGKYLFFSNPAQKHLVRLLVDRNTGLLLDSPTVVANGSETDDFIFDKEEGVFLAQVTNELQYIKGPVLKNSKNRKTLAGIAGPTACRFGRTARQKDILYVSTTGGDFKYLTGTNTLGGAIVSVNLTGTGLT